MRYTGRSLVATMIAACMCAILIAGCAQESAKLPKLIPRDVLFGNPEKARPTISPDGTMLAYLAPVDDVLNVWVRTIGEEDDRAVTSETNRDLFRYLWSADSKQILYLQDKEGNEDWGLYSVSIKTGEDQSLAAYDGVQVRIQAWDKNYPDEILLSMNRENPQLHDVYHLDLNTGDTELVARNPGNIVGWMVDSKLKVRGAIVPTPEGGFTLLVRKTEEDTWRDLLTWDPTDAMSSGPVGFNKEGDYIFLQDSRHVNASRLIKIDAETGDMVDVLVEDPNYDVGAVFTDDDTYEPQAVVITRARDEWIILDESLREDFENVKALDDGDLFITSRDNDNRNWIVGFTKDSGPIPYYAYSRDTKEATFLFVHRPEMAKYTLADMEPISFKARDGLTIEGYITYPPGVPRENLPVVLNVHGGPWHRDQWGYSPEAQWLANRGYACLQVNFRGSTGYGKNHLNAGDKEWGGKMHNDLLDAVDWAVGQGIADPANIAIYGHSYGGYAALVGATFTPDVFCCAIAGMAPSNLITFLETIPPYWKPILDLMYMRVGNPETEADFLRERSPLFKVDNITIPMLIVQGANDVRVKQAESEQVVEAMKAKGIDYGYLLFEDEGHGFVKSENRLKFYAAAEEFLAKHMGGRAEGASEM
jgi:dipeptidyl aminopeptidase/acylaminoacyl peptidase